MGQGRGGTPHVVFSELLSQDEAGRAAFLEQIASNRRGWNLTEHAAEDLAQSRVFLSEDGKTGFYLSEKGDLQNVFNNSDVPGAGRAA